LRCPDVSRDGRTLALLRSEAQSGDAYANGRRDEIGLFSTRNWKRRDVISWPQTSIEKVAFCGDGQTLLILTSTFYWAKKKSGANDVYPVMKLRMLDLKMRRERLVRTFAGSRFPQLVVSRDGKFFALYENFPISESLDSQTLALLSETAFIEIRDGSNGKKLASLRAKEGLGNAVMAFAPDNSALYFVNRGAERWPREEWKIGVEYSQLRVRGR
jgi:hypothetical protein